ncbi:MAG: hypothetical protein AAGF95_09735 [Chloroflexota bacterium]
MTSRKITWRRYTIWVGELPDNIIYPFDEVLEHTIPAQPATSTEPRRVAVRHIAPMQHHFGLLGAEFTPSTGDQLIIHVPVSTEEFVGLDRLYASVVFEALQADALRESLQQLGAGTLNVAYALQHPVDSTTSIFRRLTRYVIAFLNSALDELDEEAFEQFAEQVLQG